jgi:hypothetical protein
MFAMPKTIMFAMPKANHSFYFMPPVAVASHMTMLLF